MVEPGSLYLKHTVHCTLCFDSSGLGHKESKVMVEPESLAKNRRRVRRPTRTEAPDKRVGRLFSPILSNEIDPRNERGQECLARFFPPSGFA